MLVYREVIQYPPTGPEQRAAVAGMLAAVAADAGALAAAQAAGARQLADERADDARADDGDVLQVGAYSEP